VRLLRSLGVGLGDIGALRQRLSGADPVCSDVKAIAAGQLAHVRKRIADLRAIEVKLHCVVAILEEECADRAAADCRAATRAYDALV
jgi:DNA-binding transcriptional MerR regulator